MVQTALVETALSMTQTESGELAVSAQEMMAQKEIEASIIIANKFPRNETAAMTAVLRSCQRTTFAESALYSYPRGGQTIEGPSVKLAREIARNWGHIRVGADVVFDDEESRTVRCYAWDMQTNTKESQDVTFKKLIFRKRGGWIKPDERDLRELTNKQTATACRNCILHIVPADLIEDAMEQAKSTLTADCGADPDAARKNVARAFDALNVSVEQIEAFLGHKLVSATPHELANLRTVYKSIKDGNSVWREYEKKPIEDDDKPETGATIDDIIKPQPEEPKPTEAPAPPTTTPTALPDMDQLMLEVDAKLTEMFEDAAIRDAFVKEQTGRPSASALGSKDYQKLHLEICK